MWQSFALASLKYRLTWQIIFLAEQRGLVAIEKQENQQKNERC